MRTAFMAVLLGLLVSLTSASPCLADDPVEFNRDIRPLLADRCFQCHGPDEATREADLRLDQQAAAHERVIVPGKLDESELWRRISSQEDYERMPPPDSHKELSAEDRDLLRRWILQGAEYQQHWSFRPAAQPDVPQTEAARFTLPIDSFIYQRLIAAGLTPSDRAAKEVLIRRASLDLTGLPPTIAEIDAFLSDDSPDAYEKVVDRLLASKRFGERMAVEWMDVARYGDTSVFHADGPRDMWIWRDWVVNSYNDNMPFDEFTLKQLAGDLLPNATLEDKIATGFNRNNASTDEGGAIAEEFRVEYVVDRVKTTSMTWLGLSMECAQCHDHKYDPISQEDYYRFFAYFNQAADPGMQTRQGNQTPLVQIPDEEKQRQIPDVEATIKTCQAKQEQLFADTTDDFADWEIATRERLAGAMPDGLSHHFPLDEIPDGFAANRACAEQPLKLQGKANFMEGRIGSAIQTSGSQYLEAAEPCAELEHDDAFSFGCWIYSNGQPAGAPIARMDDARNHRGWDILLYNDGKIAVHVINKGPDNSAKVDGVGGFKPKTWHHVFATYDGSSKAAGIRLYVDGREIETATQKDSLSGSIISQAPFTVGRRSPGSVFNGFVDDVRIYDRELSADEVALLFDDVLLGPVVNIQERTDEQTRQLQEHFLKSESQPYQDLAKEIEQLNGKLADLRKPLTSVMVMQDLPKPRQTYVLSRGQYDAPDKERPVEPGVPEFLSPLPEDAPANRLGLARWIIDPENPLTARVAVNRIWKTFFGSGLVETAEDFGAQGQWPSHPELLDWLATDFVEHGWDRKRLIKQIMMSETYCQSSKIDAERFEKDPENLLLARGPRFRLSGEFVRDQALFVSGLLNGKIGGPGVKPYQPPGLWNEVSLNGNLRFRQDHGEDLYRRSLYTYWKRSAPPPSMTIFDAPTREKCTIRRGTTNTPLQALVLLNDDQFVEAARAFAQRILKEGGDSFEAKVEFAFRSCTGHKPEARIIAVLKSTLETERTAFAHNPEQATALLSIGESQRDEQLDPAKHAAWTIVASMILNFDQTMTRE